MTTDEKITSLATAIALQGTVLVNLLTNLDPIVPREAGIADIRRLADALRLVQDISE